MVLINGKIHKKTTLEGLSLQERAFLVENLDKGNCVIKIPELPSNEKTETEMNATYKAYKVGFLFDLMTNVYPAYTNVYKYSIIDKEYHLFMSHKRLLDIYKKHYVGKF